jgi:Cd2+-exporting ATPase
MLSVCSDWTTRDITASIDMEITQVPAESTLAELAALVMCLQEERLPIQDLADRVAGWFSPVILAVALAVFVIWVIVGLRVHGEDVNKAGVTALQYTIAVLVVSCPCAMLLCVPMVIAITGAVAIRKGVLFKVCFIYLPVPLRPFNAPGIQLLPCLTRLVH